jgi:hypothetical protein
MDTAAKRTDTDKYIAVRQFWTGRRRLETGLRKRINYDSAVFDSAKPDIYRYALQTLLV